MEGTLEKKKKTDELTSQKTIYNIVDCLSISLGYLKVSDICRNQRTSKEFKKRTNEALSNITVFDGAQTCSNKTESTIRTLLTKCKNITSLKRLCYEDDIENRTILLIYRFPNLLCLTFLEELEFSTLKRIIHIAPNNLKQLIQFECSGRPGRGAAVDVSPFRKCKNLKTLYIWGNIRGYSAVINECKNFTHIQLDEKQNVIETLEDCNISALTRILSLKVYDHLTTTEDNYSLLSRFVTQMTSLKEFGSNGACGNSAIQELQKCKSIEKIFFLELSCSAKSLHLLVDRSKSSKNLKEFSFDNCKIQNEIIELVGVAVKDTFRFGYRIWEDWWEDMDVVS